MYAAKWIAGMVAGIIVAGTLVLSGLILFGTAARPPELTSISDPMRRIDFADLPQLRAFAARDGQVLHYRLYPGTARDVVVLIHGSTRESSGMHAVAKTLSAAGDSVYVPDLRGHGRDGQPGDIDYIGQLQDDLADFARLIRLAHPRADISLVGHSSGGGFVLRIAEGPDARLFDRFVLVSPLLAYGTVTSRPELGEWAVPFAGRIIALKILNGFGLPELDGLPVIAFAVDPHATVPLDATYSYRMQSEFSAPPNALRELTAVAQPVVVLVGQNDELVYADRFAPLIHHERPDVPVIVVPGVNHMGMVVAPAALAALAAGVQHGRLLADLRGTGAHSSARATDENPQILAHTAWWVFAVLAILLVTGVQALQPRVLPSWRFFIVPAVFVAWGVTGIVVRAAPVPALALVWVAAVAFGVVIGWVTTRLSRFSFESGNALVRVSGTPMPLVRNVSIFAVRYGVAVAATFVARGALHAQLLVSDVVVSGLMTGYFLGWAGRFAAARRASTLTPVVPQSSVTIDIRSSSARSQS